MSSRRSNSDDARLAKALADQHVPDELRRELEADPELREEWDELQRAVHVVDGAAKDERASLAAAASDVSARDRQAVAQALEASWSARPANRTEPTRRWLAYAAVAAIVVLALALALWFGRDRTPGGAPQFLAPAKVQCLEPHGDVTAYSRFHWKLVAPEGRPAPEDVRFTLSVRSDDDPAAPPFTRAVRGEEWSPSAEEEAALPERIEWTLEAFAASGARLGSASERARRPRH